MGPDLRQLRFFVAVAEELHFTRAAQRVHVAQPSLSQTIAQLERRVGSRLIERDHGRVALTDAGQTLLGHAHRALAVHADLEGAMEEHRRGFRGTLTIGIVEHGAAELTGLVLTAARRALPDVSISVRPVAQTEQVPALVKRTVDALLTFTPHSGDERLDRVVLALEPLVVAVPSAHPLAATGSIGVADVLDEVLQASSAAEPRPTAARWALEEHRNGDPPRLADHVHTTVAALLTATAANEHLSTGPFSGTRAWPEHLWGVKYVELSDASPCELAIDFRHSDSSPVLRRFVEIAQRIAVEMIGLVPRAWLPTT